MNLQDTIDRLIADAGDLHLFLKGPDDQDVQTDNGPIPTLAKLTKNATQSLSASLNATSKSSTDLSIGLHTLVVETGKNYTQGQWVNAVCSGGYMTGMVQSYSTSTGELIINVVNSKGSTGSYSSWVIALSGAPGPTGQNGKDGNDGTSGTGSSGPLEKLITKMAWE